MQLNNQTIHQGKASAITETVKFITIAHGRWSASTNASSTHIIRRARITIRTCEKQEQKRAKMTS
jgi:hypothetical protein